MVAWIVAHPWVAAGVAVVALSTVLNLVLRHYGPSHPRLKRALRFALDLLAALPMRGSPSRGLQLPGLSWSAPPTDAPERRIRSAVGPTTRVDGASER